MSYSRKVLTTALAVILSGCVPGPRYEPERTAVRSTAPNAKGFIVLGLAEENARKGSLFARYLSFTIALRQQDTQAQVVARRDSCVSMVGNIRGETCAGQAALAWRVLEVTPGTWTIATITEERVEGVPARNVHLAVPFPAGTAFQVGAGEVIYIGDFLFSIDFETQSVELKTHTRHDSDAEHALDDYPGLRGTVIYRDPAKQT